MVTTFTNAKKSKSNKDKINLSENTIMKQSVLYVLTIGAMFLFGSCGKDYDYRDKWVGEYEYECFSRSELIYTGTLSVSKYAQDRLLIIISEPISFSPPETRDDYYYFQVQKDGTVRLPESNIWVGLCWSGCFKNRNNLELISYMADSGGEYTSTYKCKKIK